MKFTRALFLAPLVLSLAACWTVGPDYSLPKDAVINQPLANAPLIGSDAATITSAPVPPNWWHLYDDPVLNDLVQQALVSNADLRVAALNLARSRAAVGVAEAQGGFSGGASAAFKRAQEAGEQYLIFDKLPVANEGDVGISVAYEIDLFGTLRRGTEAARADSDATQAAADTARITVVADVVRAYVESCSAAEDLSIAQRSLDLQRQRVSVQQRLQQAGRGNAPDVTTGQTQVQTLSADIPRYIARQRIAQYQLATLLARSPSDLPKAVLTCHDTPQIRQPLPVGDGAAPAEPPSRCPPGRAQAGRRDGAHRRGDGRALSDDYAWGIGGIDGRGGRSWHFSYRAMGLRPAHQLDLSGERRAWAYRGSAIWRTVGARQFR